MSKDLKKLYYTDFAKHKLHLTTESKQHVDIHLDQYLQYIFSTPIGVARWLGQLHLYFKFHQLDLAKFAKILCKIIPFVTWPTPSLQKLIMMIHEQRAPTHLAPYIIDVIFEAVNILVSTENVDIANLQEWYKAFFEIVSQADANF